jgi:Asp-tRNA(Asn)/Glu-tRNA(Gln) amidotransferase A subunit family amidase
MGSETGGSIVGPSMRCGVTGLRPTYGRVPRTGAMTLCWSLDKLGPMTRSVEDALLVLNAISGPDDGDLESVPSKLDFESGASVKGLRVGYFPKWMNEAPATNVDRAALATVKKLGMVPVEVSIPDWPYDSLDLILFAEAAAAFEEITLNHQVDELKVQVPDAWPNVFRQSRFLSAVDYVQSDRFRRKVAEEMARVFSEVNLLLVPYLLGAIRALEHGVGTVPDMDKAMVLGEIATWFGKNGVSLAAMEMKTLGSGRGEIAFLTHACKESSFRLSLEGLGGTGVVDEVSAWIRVEEDPGR